MTKVTVIVDMYSGKGKIVNCLCPDGVRRTVQLTNHPDTWFSIPARVKAHGKTVTGFVAVFECEDTKSGQDYRFVPYDYRKNGKIFLPKG
jgi:hypothetical protein